jgi:mono/diheme cytochrome c family protein
VTLAALALLAAPPAVTPALLQKGEDAYLTYCAACHGEKGDGNGPSAASLTPRPRNFRADAFKAGTTPDQLFHTVSAGLPGTPMVGFGYLPEEDRWALVAWVTTFLPPPKK